MQKGFKIFVIFDFNYLLGVLDLEGGRAVDVDGLVLHVQLGEGGKAGILGVK